MLLECQVKDEILRRGSHSMHGGDEKYILNFDRFEGKRLLGRPTYI
jgi:hypothetical protein